MFLCCFLDFSVDVGAFVIGLSQISSFISCYKSDPMCIILQTPSGVQIGPLRVPVANNYGKHSSSCN